jgi:GNAT superfamily N-acetyltransferase
MAKNVTDFTVRIRDFNIIATKPLILEKLRKLTLHENSGMNYELNHLLRDVKSRTVNCSVLMGYSTGKIVAWALLSKEPSDWYFPSGESFSPDKGTLLQIYVDPLHRRKGYASRIVKVAYKKTNKDKLCIIPWDNQSRIFYNTVSKFNIHSM